MTQQHNTCSNCGYYRQHYIWFQGYTKIGTGHCTHPPRTRNCYADMKACEKWIVQTDEYRNNYINPEDNEKQMLYYLTMSFLFVEIIPYIVVCFSF